jgi:hypothetical protein
MSVLNPPKQAEQGRINEAFNYALGLRYLDAARALELSAQLPSEAHLRQRHTDILDLANVSGRSSHVAAAMRRARGELEDAAGYGLVEAGDPREGKPPFWGFSSELEALLILGVMVHAGSLIVDDLLKRKPMTSRIGGRPL